MPSTQQPQDESPPSGKDPVGGQPGAMPDEDGPHDVPDDKVIEKTLPSKTPSDRDGRAF
jgi:hypothetical protein